MAESSTKPRRSFPRFSLRTLLILVAVVALQVGVGRWAYLNRDEYGVATLPCGEGRKIIITAETTWEISQAFHYQVIANRTIVVPRWTFYERPPHETLQFSLVSAENGGLVGVVREQGDSRDVVIVHDFDTGDSWPPICFYGPLDNVKRKRLLDAFERLKAVNPGLRLRVRG